MVLIAPDVFLAPLSETVLDTGIIMHIPPEHLGEVFYLSDKRPSVRVK